MKVRQETVKMTPRYDLSYSRQGQDRQDVV
jgi:hypothetical protein